MTNQGGNPEANEAIGQVPTQNLEIPVGGGLGDYSALNHAVLGARGNSGRPIVDALLDHGVQVTAMGRKWDDRPFGDRVGYRAVDVKDVDGLKAATEDIGVLYVATAVPYDVDMWESEWPAVMDSVLEAAKANGSKIVFLDNVFMYGHVEGPMTEETPFNPISRKGEVRARVANTLLEAMHSGDVTATIGRSADFYGPRTSLGFRFFEPAIKDGKVTWLGRLDVPRTFSSLSDNGRALAILGNDPRADNEVWHMPADAARDGHYFVELAESILGRELEVTLLSGADMEAEAKRTGEKIQETHELMYQYDFPYIFDSGKFQRTFGMQPTSYEEGFKQTIDAMRAKG